MRNFKFFNKKIRIEYRSVFVDYTTEYNGKSFTSLRFAERNQTNFNPNVEVYQGTFLRFKRLIERDSNLDWLHNKPVIHLIALYSNKFNNCQRLIYIDFFSVGRYRFGKNQKMKIFYEKI